MTSYGVPLPDPSPSVIRQIVLEAAAGASIQRVIARHGIDPGSLLGWLEEGAQNPHSGPCRRLYEFLFDVAISRGEKLRPEPSGASLCFALRDDAHEFNATIAAATH